MTRRLQETGFDRSTYERPNREWVCGRTGQACPMGPDTAGHCITTHECMPSRDGDRWMCARPTAFGGECPDGPFPDGTCCNAIATCQPQLSLRAKRGRAVRWTIVMTIGMLGIALAGDGGLSFIFPGPVTHQHGTIEKDCASCHSAGTGGAAHWLSSALASNPTASDSDRCQVCHDLGSSSTIAHSVPAQDLARKTARMRAYDLDMSRPVRFTLAKIGPGIPLREGGELACAVCHQEHRGANHDLNALTNDQCQVCHLVQFERFADGHPALGAYPYGRRTRIIFNHQTHREDYFPDEGREVFSCSDCHAPEATGRTMTVNPFQATCGDCHDGDVRAAGTKGIAFINLPAIDTRGLRAAGIDPGQWPRIEQPKPISPFVALLLAGDERLSAADRKAVADIGEDTSQISGRTQFETQALGRYLWSLKLLLNDLRDDGHRAIASRLRSPHVMGGSDIAGELLSDLTSGLERETVQSAIDQWFPDLEREAAIFEQVTQDLSGLEKMTSAHWSDLGSRLRERARQRAGKARPTPEVVRGAATWVGDGGFYLTSRDASIRYRSSGHADPFVRAWLDVSAGFTHKGDNTGDAASAAEELFAGLRNSKATGRCALCHSADQEPSVYGSLGSARKVNWRPFTPAPNRRLPTEFRHQPHFSLDNTALCDTCHQMREIDGDDFEDAYAEDAAAQGHVLNFEPIALSVCGDCHTQRAAGDDCVSCHNYHLGESKPIHLTAAGSKEFAPREDGEDGEDGNEEE
ncbi:MAG: hypothetical protein ACI9QQ_001601 [Myxococcota bacterium]